MLLRASPATAKEPSLSHPAAREATGPLGHAPGPAPRPRRRPVARSACQLPVPRTGSGRPTASLTNPGHCPRAEQGPCPTGQRAQSCEPPQGSSRPPGGAAEHPAAPGRQPAPYRMRCATRPAAPARPTPGAKSLPRPGRPGSGTEDHVQAEERPSSGWTMCRPAARHAPSMPAARHRRTSVLSGRRLRRPSRYWCSGVCQHLVNPGHRQPAPRGDSGPGCRAFRVQALEDPRVPLLRLPLQLGGVFEGSGGSPALARITACGVALQLALAYGLSGSGLPGIRLAMALAMARQCAAIARMYRRTEHPTATDCDKSRVSVTVAERHDGQGRE
jgi:hypothetical protein